MAQGDLFTVFLEVRAEQVWGPETDWELVANHLAAKLTSDEMQIGNTDPKVFKVKATVDTGGDLEP